MGNIRREIIDKSRNESQKNVTIFFEDVKKLEVTNTHSVAWIRDRYVGNDGSVENFQKVQLINADILKSYSNEIDKYGIMVLQTTPGRYTESFGILIRKNEFDKNKNEAIDRMPSTSGE